RGTRHPGRDAVHVLVARGAVQDREATADRGRSRYECSILGTRGDPRRHHPDGVLRADPLGVVHHDGRGGHGVARSHARRGRSRLTQMGSSTDLSRIWSSPVPGTRPRTPDGDGRARRAGRRSDLRVLARGGSLSLVGTIVNALLGFVIVILITRGQGARGAGILFEAIALFTILSNTAELGAD